MDDMENQLVVLLVLAAICGVSDATRITIGIIVDPSDAAVVRENDTKIASDVTVVWRYVNYSELFRLYGAVRHFDSNPEVDLIVITGFVPSPWVPLHLLEARNKHVVKLHKDTTKDTQELLFNLTKQYTNESWEPPASLLAEPVCKKTTNISAVLSSGVLLADTVTTAPAEILARLVQGEGWTTLHVFYDSQSEKEAKLFVDSLSTYGTAFTLFNVETVRDINELLMKVYRDSSERTKPQIDVALICRFECLIKVLHAANVFDDLKKETKTLMTLFSRWLVIVYDYSSFVDAIIQRIARELSNVVVLVVPEFTSIPTQSISTYLRKIYADSRSVSTEEEDSNMNLLDIFKTGLLTCNPTTMCSGYVIKTLLWTNSGRDFSDVGHAYLNTSVHLPSELFPNMKYGYSQRLLTVTTLEYVPFTIISSNNGTKEYNGICMELLDELSRILNFTYRIVPPPDNMWGSVDRVENGTNIFNGMIGQLQRHEVDIAAASLAIIPEREQEVDFSYPYHFEYTTVILKRPDQNVYKWRTLLDPFKLNVLLFIGISLILVTVVVFLIEKYGAYYTVPEHEATRNEQGGLHRLHESFWYIYGALLCQGGVGLPDSFAGRTLVSGWWIFCIVIVATYCGNLIAFLTVSKEITPFNTLEEMAATKGEYKWGTLGGSNWELVFKSSPLPDFRMIGDAMIEWNETDPGIFSGSLDYQIDRVKKGGYAYIGDVTMIELTMDRECDLTMIKQKFLPMSYGFGFQPKSPHTAIFSDQIMKSHEAGLLEIWRRKWWPRDNFCFTNALPQAKPITMMDVQSAFYVCAIGFALGFLAFAIEVLIFRCRKKRSGEPDESTSGEQIPEINTSSEQSPDES